MEGLPFGKQPCQALTLAPRLRLVLRNPQSVRGADSAINTSSRIALPNRSQVTLRRDDVAGGVLATVAAPVSPRGTDALGPAADGGAGRGARRE